MCFPFSHSVKYLQGFENALSCAQPDRNVDSKHGNLVTNVQMVSTVTKLRDMARALIASHSGTYNLS